MNPVAHLIKPRGKKLNILTCPTHERYQTGFKDLDATFYLFRDQRIENGVVRNNIKDWANKYAPLPENHILLPHNTLPHEVIFDVVFSQNKFGQFGVLQDIARKLQIPLVSLEHTLPVKEWDAQTKQAMLDMRGDANVFISEFSRREWGFDDVPNTSVIHHMVDTDIFKPVEDKFHFGGIIEHEREETCLSVCNDWINRDYFCGFKLWQHITDGLPVKVIGDTPGLSKPASSVESLAEEYASSLIFVNTSLISPIPTSLLEAMAAGCICISTATCMIPEVIEDGVNGFLSNDPAVLRKRIEEILANPNKYRQVGIQARNTVLTKFHKNTFNAKWDQLFRSVIK